MDIIGFGTDMIMHRTMTRKTIWQSYAGGSLSAPWCADPEKTDLIYSGLTAGVFTRDMSRAMRMAKRLEAGTVYINEYFAGEMASPFGGVKKSGIGRERGLETLANYTRVKNVVINIGG